MAIQETILGPNTSKFTWKATDTVAQIMTAVDSYIVAHGWELFDAAASTTGMSGTTPLARVYRTLQDGSTTVYKYVQIGFSATFMMLKTWESWNATTHVGTNEGSFVNIQNNQPNTSYSVITFQTGVDNSSLFLFVNPRWLAMRQQYNNLTYGRMIGAFEIKKDFGEDPSFPTNIFMTNETRASYPSNSAYNGFYGVVRSTIAPASTGTGTNYYNNIMTTLGAPSTSYPISNVFAETIPNSTLTMTAYESTAASTPAVWKMRGRIFGLKLVVGGVYWNDMDQVQVLVDSESFQNTTGTLVSHHLFNQGQGTYVRFVLPL